MAGIINFGSINIDHVYQVPHFPGPGETLSSSAYTVGLGGKGLNQSIALARAGAAVTHLGGIGADGAWILDRMASEGIDISHVPVLQKEATGHARILVTPSGENNIVLHGGANHGLRPSMVNSALGKTGGQTLFLCQNETVGIPEAIEQAHSHGLKVWFNPAPMSPDVMAYPLHMVDGFVLNETEGRMLANANQPGEILSRLGQLYPAATIVLTLGKDGARALDRGRILQVSSPPVTAVDTTAAGDTFIGFLLQEITAGMTLKEALIRACRAAACCVGKPGAADSIPFAHEL